MARRVLWLALSGLAARAFVGRVALAAQGRELFEEKLSEAWTSRRFDDVSRWWCRGRSRCRALRAPVRAWAHVARPLPDEKALLLRARARRRADWARRRLQGEALEEMPTVADRGAEVAREGRRILERVEAKRAKDRAEAELRASGLEERRARRRQEKLAATERARSGKERRRAQRVAALRGAQLPSLREAQAMSLLQLRDALWDAGYAARGLPSPKAAKEMEPEELKIQLREAKAGRNPFKDDVVLICFGAISVRFHRFSLRSARFWPDFQARFLIQLRRILSEAPSTPENRAFGAGARGAPAVRAKRAPRSFERRGEEKLRLLEHRARERERAEDGAGRRSRAFCS